MLVSGGEHERVREPQRVVLRAKLGGPFGDRGGERDDGDSHGGDRLACVVDASGASERDQRFAVGAGRSEKLTVGSVGLVDVVDGSGVVAVGGVEQPDQDAGVEDQQFHSSRNWSSSPGR